jgi:hypothetical protein
VLSDIGSNTHVQIDAHLADTDEHFTQAAIDITISQVNDFTPGDYSVTGHDHDAAYLAIGGTSVQTSALKSATTTVNVAAAAAPIVGQVLTATGSTAATWQTPAAAGAADIVQVGTMSANWVGYFSADKNLTGDEGFQWDGNSLTISSTSGWALDVSGINRDIRIGSDHVGGTDRTDSTNKSGTLAGVHYLNAEEPIAGIMTYGEVADNTVRIGGGSVTMNAATAIEMYLAANNITTTGTKIFDLTQSLMTVGNYSFDIDETVGAGQDSYILSYNDGTGLISLVAAGILPTGTPVDDQIGVFTAAAVMEGDANFTWTGVILTAAGMVYSNTTGDLTVPRALHAGDASNASPGVVINGTATATPYVQFEQNSVTKALIRFSNASTRLELSSSADNIELRPGNVDTYTLKQATMKAGNMTFNIDQTIGAGQDDFILTYDHSSGEIGLEASAGGGDAVISQFLLIGA